MSRTRKLVTAVAGAAALSWLGAFALEACGPFFADWILGGDALVTNGPTALFDDKMTALLGKGAVPAAAESHQERTEEADREDLAAVLATQDLPAGRRQEIAQAHARARVALRAYADAVDGWREEAAWADPPPPRPAFDAAAVEIPLGLPAEFDLYLRGAIAYHGADWPAARQAWERLLALPAAERRHRSTWAAYMLGRTAEESGAPDAGERAVSWYARTRELAGQGFADRLGLALSSLGREAYVARHRGGDWAKAVSLYAEQHRQGGESALLSLRLTLRAAFRTGGDALEQLARDETVRPLATTYLLAAWDSQGTRSEQAAAWLAAAQKAPGEAADAADLAWVAYLAGDFAGAGAWLERAPADAPMARWVKAKLLLREGKLDEAGTQLSALSRDFPVAPHEQSPDPEMVFYLGGEEPLAGRSRLAGEAGAVLLHQEKFVDALDRLLAGGYWVDAAYVAERVLTEQELTAYVDAHLPAELAGQAGENEGFETGGRGLPRQADTAAALRYLTGRRLARAGRYTEAERYLPAARRPGLERLAAAAVPNPSVEALGRAACTARHEGLEILGTEIGPDWFRWEGQYDPPHEPATRGRGEEGESRLLAPSAEETRRDRAHRATTDPWKRFHYRYRAAALARRAADSLPDGSEDKARWLATAGAWLQNRDPEASRPYLRELLRCCGETKTGKEARRIGRLPVTNACGAP